MSVVGAEEVLGMPSRLGSVNNTGVRRRRVGPGHAVPLVGFRNVGAGARPSSPIGARTLSCDMGAVVQALSPIGFQADGPANSAPRQGRGVSAAVASRAPVSGARVFGLRRRRIYCDVQGRDRGFRRGKIQCPVVPWGNGSKRRAVRHW